MVVVTGQNYEYATVYFSRMLVNMDGRQMHFLAGTGEIYDIAIFNRELVYILQSIIYQGHGNYGKCIGECIFSK